MKVKIRGKTYRNVETLSPGREEINLRRDGDSILLPSLKIGERIFVKAQKSNKLRVHHALREDIHINKGSFKFSLSPDRIYDLEYKEEVYDVMYITEVKSQVKAARNTLVTAIFFNFGMGGLISSYIHALEESPLVWIPFIAVSVFSLLINSVLIAGVEVDVKEEWNE